MKEVASMKNYIFMVAVAVLTFDAVAVVGGRSYGYKPGSGVKRLGEGGSSEVKAKGAFECIHVPVV